MTNFLFALQIFIAIVMSSVIILQKCSGDGIVTVNYNSQIPNNTQHSFIDKLVIFLILIFMINSLVLAKNATSQTKGNLSLTETLENRSNVTDPVLNNIVKME